MAQKLWLPSHFSSGMILQQQKPVHLHGLARANQSVSCQLTRQPFDQRPISPLDQAYGLVHETSVQSDSQGRFTLELPAFQASLDPFTLTVTCGKQTIVLEDILFGEVWLTGGQSNMAMPLRATRQKNQLETIANVPYVRVLTQALDGLDKKQKDYAYQPLAELASASWIMGDQPEAVAEVSAVAFNFAKALHLSLKIPVAFIETAVPDCLIQSWLNRSSVENNGELLQHIRKSGFYRTRQDWNLNSDTRWNARQPSALFNHKIAPLRDLALRGMLWYHGESEFNATTYYALALKTLVSEYQNQFRPVSSQGLVFLYVQLSPWYSGHREFTKLAEFNEMLTGLRRQLPCPAALLPNYDPLPTYDTATDDWRHPVHPDQKQPIGERLQSLALGLCYDRKKMNSAPECIDIEKIGNKLMLSFEPTGDGLRLSSGEQRLRGFTICGPDRIFLEAEAKLLYGVRVLVWHDQIKNPEAVAYAYADLNQHANLTSSDQIPVLPFRSDLKPAKHFPPAEWTHCEALETWACPHLENQQETGFHKAWTIFNGNGQFKVEPANKTEGDAAFLIRYQTDENQIFGFGPVIDYDSAYPPSDWQHFSQLMIDLFNADQQMKKLKLRLVLNGNVSVDLPEQKLIIAALRWQTLSFSLTDLASEQLAAVKGVHFMLEDKKRQGEIYIDNIRLRLPADT